MAQLKILFADDQIPDENLSDNDIKTSESQSMRETVKTLRDAGYDVTIARTHKEALDLIEGSHFDIAIVDLNWITDESLLPESQRMSYGWKISDKIEEADKKLMSKKTLQIIFSSLFTTKGSISIDAALKGKLPLFKTYNTTLDPPALKAAIKYLEQKLTNLSFQEQFNYDSVVEYRQRIIQNFDEKLKQQKLWFILTTGFVAISISLLIAGAIGIIFWNLQVDTLTSVSSIITSFISSLLYFHLRTIQNDVKESLQKIELEFKEAIKQFHAVPSTKAAPSP